MRTRMKSGPNGRACADYDIVNGGGRWCDAAMSEAPQDPELEKKAHRAQMILYGVMIFFVILPFILLWLKNRGVFGHP